MTIRLGRLTFYDPTMDDLEWLIERVYGDRRTEGLDGDGI